MRVAIYTTGVAIKMGITDYDQLRDISLGGIFHDIGKKEVPLEVLNKQGPLNEQEWEQMKSHPVVGFEIVKESNLSFVTKEIIHHHHEKLDGSGYPDNLKNCDIIPEVQMATIADVYDALTSSRSYQNKRNRFEALDLMKNKLLGNHFGAETFRALVSCLVEKNQRRR
jgi:putative nucleotidyltransferase with HDIG domain